jgi:diguanylate cyclase (GGDEF)-like protein
VSQRPAKGVRLLPWIWQSYLRTALVPLLLIELALVAAYLLTNDAIREKNATALRAMAEERLLSSADLRADIIGRQLEGIVRSTDFYRWLVGRALLDGDPEVDPEAPDPLAHLARSPGGAYHTRRDDGHFAVFYSAATDVGQAELAKLRRLYAVDPAMEQILASHEDVVQIYFNGFDSLNVIRPYFDVLAQYPEAMDIPSYNFYYLADAEHNPARQPVWTDVYVDPAGQGWMSSCIAPVYRGDFLEGVVGLDVTVKQIVRYVEELKVPWHGYALLLDGSGTIMAMPTSAEADWGVNELTDHHYAAAIERDIFKPAAFNVLKRDDSKGWARKVMNRQEGYETVAFGGDKAIAWSTIPQTGWKLLLLVPEANIYRRVDRLRDQVRDLGLSMLAGLAVFYVFFFAITFYRARRMSEHLASSLVGISRMTETIAKGVYDNRPDPVGLTEIDATTASVARLGRELGEQLKARSEAERSLAELNANLEKRIRQRTQALEQEVARRKHLEDKLLRMAQYDPLTDLPNRRLFEDRLQQAAKLAERTGNLLAVLFIDLDRFKEINDRWGHEAGDQLLTLVAQRLRGCVRSSDTVARFGGDEFCALLVDAGDRTTVEVVAGNVLARLAEPFELAQGETRISTSIGIVAFPNRHFTWDELLHRADTAMYRVKNAGGDNFAWAMDES